MQVVWQIIGVTAGAGWSFVMTSIILLTLKYIPFLSLKAPHDDEDRLIITFILLN